MTKKIMYGLIIAYMSVLIGFYIYMTHKLDQIELEMEEFFSQYHYTIPSHE